MTKITLIRPSALVPDVKSGNYVVPPLGLAYLAGTLRMAGHDVTCVDGPGEALKQFKPCVSDPTLLEQGLSIEQIVDRIPRTTQVIGISCMFSFEWFHVIELIRSIRARFPSRFIVLGGEHATADYEYILRNTPEVDACVVGESENKILGLLQAMEAGVSKRELPGAAVFDPETRVVRKNDAKDGQYRILDVDSIARPAWDLFPMAAYLELGIGFASRSNRTIPMLASRGCPHRCTFCSSPQMWTTRWSPRDVDDVIDEIKSYIRDYRINRIEFYDLTAIIDKRWILRFCGRLIEENLGITWAMPSGTRTEALTQDVLELIKKSGCSRLVYPLETGNPRVSDLIKKKINYKRSLSSMRNAVRAGIIVKTNTIIGFPFQTNWDLARECVFAIRLAWIGSHDIIFHTFAPYPGSELHAQLVAQGAIVKDENYPRLLRKLLLSDYAEARSWSPRISPRSLGGFSLFGMSVFFLFQHLFRPHRLVGLTCRVYEKKPINLLEGALTNAIRRFNPFTRIRVFGRANDNIA